MIYLFFSIVIVIVSFKMFKSVSGSMAVNKINMISFIFYFYMIMQTFIGSILIVNNLVENTPLKLIENESSRVIGWFIIQYMMIAVPLGMLIAKRFMNIKNVQLLFSNYTTKSVKGLVTDKDSFFKLFVFILSIISITSTLFLYLKTGSLGLLSLSNFEDQKSLLLYRMDSSLSFSGITAIIKNIFSLTLTPILSYIYFIYYYKDKYKKDLVMFIIMFIVSFLALTFNLAKSPFIFYLFSFVFVFVLLKGSIKKSTLYVLVVGLFSLMIMIFLQLENHESILEIFTSNTSLLGRIFISQVSGFFLMIDIFPDKHDFIGFASTFKQFYQIVGLQTIDPAARITMEYAYPIGVAEGYMNLLSTIFIGEAWANFSYFGVLFSPIYLGFIIEIFYLFILKNRKSPLFISILVYSSYSTNFASSLNPYIFNYILWASIIILFFIYSFSYFISNKRRRMYGK
jgi:oligosaccharide repeat unit polymerase